MKQSTRGWPMFAGQFLAFMVHMAGPHTEIHAFAQGPPKKIIVFQFECRISALGVPLHMIKQKVLQRKGTFL